MLEGSRRLRAGESLDLTVAGDVAGSMRLLDHLGDGEWRVAVDCDGTVEQVLDRIGQTPLPPYIKRDKVDRVTEAEDRDRYQTVFARRIGAIAAPTAGLHLTGSLLDRVGEAGVTIAHVTLHVGVGTFKPIDVAEITEHKMHSERYELTGETADAVKKCRQRGGRVVAVGTTAVRTLESSAQSGGQRLVQPGSGATELFIYPPYDFKVVDVMLTNFHLPRSTLLALVMAFAGVDLTRRAYELAMAERYRFYSYGDAMLIT
jgi:S-adenosylmethionine:tRNA ribosyltransferase-isomerase